MYAIAIDLGTTTLAASLIEPASGRRLAMTGSLNPQRRFGADVVSRLDAAVGSDETLREMSQLIRAELWRLVCELCETAGIPWNDVQQVAIAGNPAMQHHPAGTAGQVPGLPPLPAAVNRRYTPDSAAELGWQGACSGLCLPLPGRLCGRRYGSIPVWADWKSRNRKRY